MDDELKRRGDLFRQLGVQDVAGYKRAGGTEPIPRSLLIIDEFQEFFVEDDNISQTASLLLDRIVRQGRAFGIHVLLGSQTLGGAYTVARTTLGQMVIRIALQCNEADAYLIMDDNNPAPRLLSRPGEGIYNDMAGMIEGNSPFQVVWLPDEVRETYLTKVRARADERKSEVRRPKAEVGADGGRCIRGRLSSRAMRRPMCGRIRCCAACSRPPSLKRAGRRPHLARRAQLHQRADRSRLQPAKREQPAVRRPARRGHAGHPVGRPGCRWPPSTPWAPRVSSSAMAPRPAPPSASSSSASSRPFPHPITLAKQGDLGEHHEGAWRRR